MNTSGLLQSDAFWLQISALNVMAIHIQGHAKVSKQATLLDGV